MRAVLFTEWWMSLGWEKQIFWSVAIVSSLLLFILLVLNLFAVGSDFESEEERTGRKQHFYVDPRSIMVFFTAFSWTSVLCSSYEITTLHTLIYGLLAGLLASAFILFFVRSFLTRIYRLHQFEVTRIVESTGEVLQPIPPHRNGFGKVHLNLRGAPYEIEAITAGKEIPAGSPIRVVGVIDERVLLVEALEKGYPGRVEEERERDG